MQPQAGEQWQVDSSRSRLTFKLHHLVFHQIQGHFGRLGGTLLLDRDRPASSNIQIWVDLASIETEAPERDAHLKSPEFLDVARFPRATFASTNVEARGHDVIVTGRLDLHGVVHEIKLAARAVISDESKREQREIFSASTKINRQEFGLRWNQDLDMGGVVVGDQVDIGAHIEVVRRADGT